MEISGAGSWVVAGINDLCNVEQKIAGKFDGHRLIATDADFQVGNILVDVDNEYAAVVVGKDDNVAVRVTILGLKPHKGQQRTYSQKAFEE